MGLFRKIIGSLIASPTPEFIGEQGEQAIAKVFGRINFWGRKGRLLQNVYVPYGNNETVEIDLLYITQKGIFVIESKNYSGFIFGNEDHQNWTSTLYAGKDWFGRKKVEKYHFYNPIRQNSAHIKALRHYLGASIKAISIIVFSERCELKNISVKSPDVFVCKQNEFPTIVRDIWNSYPDVFCEEQINSIFEKLLPLTGQSGDVKKKHISDVQSKLNTSGICPWCGSPLVLRTAKRGANAGHQFWGCSRYPNCKYTKNI